MLTGIENKIGSDQSSQPLSVGPTEARKRDRRNASLSSDSVEQSQANARDVVASWLTSGANFLRRRPSEKRPCTRASLNTRISQPAVLVKNTQSSEADFDDSVSNASEQTPTNLPHSPALIMDDTTCGRNSSPGSPSSVDKENPSKEELLGIAKLSPPSQSYDASLAIRNAVNHLDLANYDNTMIDFIQSQGSQSDRFCVPSRTVIHGKVGNATSRFLVRRRFALSIEPFRHYTHRRTDRPAGARQHKPTCRHARDLNKKPDNDFKPTAFQTSKPRDLDETGADLSLPSDFLLSEASEMPQPEHLKSPHQDLSKSGSLLPLVGGSPTGDLSLFKRPKAPIGHPLPRTLSSAEQKPSSVNRESAADVETQLPGPAVAEFNPPMAQSTQQKIDSLQSKKPIVNGSERDQFDVLFGRPWSTTLEDAFLDVKIAC
ncbi:unnamed protein product [Echinostoma caproni]|uniref:ULP_PROTEASE domain-containing protein n=1 Tax=Echinostoma caproni TaxID=27848 RepID=A0A183B3L3_9TREM|nr:unnamed protein product [Echinostoma caproni]